LIPDAVSVLSMVMLIFVFVSRTFFAARDR
jgi:hypothetical protein